MLTSVTKTLIVKKNKYNVHIPRALVSMTLIVVHDHLKHYNFY